jgi:hypothetical protein
LEKPAIELVEELYTADESKAMVERFREDGFVILPDVFKRETVEPFLSQLEELMFHDGLPWRLPDDASHYTYCAKTPRGFQLLPDVLSRSVVKPFEGILSFG